MNEYRHILSWARMREHEEWLNFPPEGGFDIKLSGYRPMSDYVGRLLARDIQWSLGEGKQAVVFETARGVGEPFVTYSDFLDVMIGELYDQREGLQLINIEVLASAQDLERRMLERFLADPVNAPPPGIEKKYLHPDGTPLCFATQNLAQAELEIPLVLNESLRNGIPKEAFEGRIHDELYPRMLSTLGMIPHSPEGRFQAPERP